LEVPAKSTVARSFRVDQVNGGGTLPPGNYRVTVRYVADVLGSFNGSTYRHVDLASPPVTIRVLDPEKVPPAAVPQNDK
jgi:hypothetical protein